LQLLRPAGVIVLAATNRPDVLDQALLRPGRFDRQVTVDRPDVQGRVAILKVHARGKALGKDVDLEKISRRCADETTSLLLCVRCCDCAAAAVGFREVACMHSIRRFPLCNVCLVLVPETGSAMHLSCVCRALCVCRTPGFTGADLQNLMNEAAILAARRNLKEISKEEIADALERIIAGAQ
jgi:ATP-dependent 26S proteasome regulatory subunit